MSEITGLFNNIVNNFANIDYFASSKEILKVSYDFSYGGTNAFGLQQIDLNGKWIGNVGISGTSFTGTIIFPLVAGDNNIATEFFPNVSGTLSSIDGTLSGRIIYSFEEVPEPSTFLMLGSAIAGVGLLRRRFKK